MLSKFSYVGWFIFLVRRTNVVLLPRKNDFLCQKVWLFSTDQPGPADDDATEFHRAAAARRRRGILQNDNFVRNRTLDFGAEIVGFPVKMTGQIPGRKPQLV